MPKRDKLSNKRIINNFCNICLFYSFILLFSFPCCIEEYQLQKVNENILPDGIYKKTITIKNEFYCEIYDDIELESLELFLTDSINFRIFVMSYRFDYDQNYKINIDSNKVIFYCQFPKEDNYKLEKRSEYTFEELKTKNNLRKGKAK